MSEKKEVWVEIEPYFDFEGDFDVVLQRMRGVREKHVGKKLRIEKEYGGEDGFDQLIIQCARLETDKEFAERCEQEEYEKTRQEKWDKEKYEELKKKFETRE